MRPSIMKVKTQRDSLGSDLSSLSSTHSKASTHSKKRSRVSFDKVEVQEYPMILDEARYKNPFLTISWEPCKRRVSSFEEYESIRSHEEAYVVDPKERLYICLRSGVPSAYIREHLAKPNPYLVEDDAMPAEGASCKGLLSSKSETSANSPNTSPNTSPTSSPKKSRRKGVFAKIKMPGFGGRRHTIAAA